MATKNYLNKRDLLEEIYKSREQDELTDKCLKMLMLLANKTIRKLYYKCEDDKQNCLSEAYYDIIKNWRVFDPDFAKYHGYENLKKGDEIRVTVDHELKKTAAAIVVENFPVEDLIEKTKKELRQQKMKGVEIVYVRETKSLLVSRKPTLNEIETTSIDKDSIVSYNIDASEYNRITLDYIVKKNSRDIKTFDKFDVVIKDPNPFSFFTSTCTNGFAKGWKKLNPKKSKGKLVSLDSGFGGDGEGDGLHSF